MLNQCYCRPPSGASPICMKPSPTLGDGPETLQLMPRRTTRTFGEVELQNCILTVENLKAS